MSRFAILIAFLMVALPLIGGDSGSDAAAIGTIYYLAPNGNDANPGTLAQPWRTFQTT